MAATTTRKRTATSVRRKKGPPPPDRHAQVAQAAYFLAEKRGFEPGNDWGDWFLAENMLDSGSEAGPRG